jgi:hypothetical protein
MIKNRMVILVCAPLVLVSCGTAGAPMMAPSTVKTTVTRTIEVESTPKACVDALDAAEDIHDLAVQGFEIAADMVDAASLMQSTKLERLSANLDALTPTMKAAVAAYNRAAENCRGGE